MGLGEKMKILVVDDSVTLRSILRKELEQGGYEIIESSNGTKALEILGNTRIDLVTLGVHMSGINGFKTCEKLRSEEFEKKIADHKDGSLPVIFVTGSDTMEDRMQGFKAGASDFLTKPFMQGELLALVNSLLNPDKKFDGLTALVVDDSKVVRNLIVSVLKKLGIEAIVAQDGQEAFEIMRSQGKDIDLIITDVEMPFMNGDELCRKIRQDLNLMNTPIIFLSGSTGQSANVLELFKVGGTDYLPKPFVKEELLARLEVHLDLRLKYREIKKQSEEMEKLNLFIKNALQKYVSPDYIEILINRPDMLELGGEERELTIMFTDLQGFTSISENLKPRALLEMLNEYLDGMTKILMEHYGTLDKYQGDAIVAFWNAPLEQNNHSIMAVNTALDMLEFSRSISKRLEDQGKPPLITRIGINTGNVIVGNIGSKKRFNYTIIGDEANLAARLEGANKLYGTTLMISESTHNKIHKHFRCRQLDNLRVKGKKKPVKVYEVLARIDEAFNSKKEGMLNLYNQGISAYQKREWKEGIRFFTSALALNPEDSPSITYLERCQLMHDNPPGLDWDGSFKSISK